MLANIIQLKLILKSFQYFLRYFIKFSHSFTSSINSNFLFIFFMLIIELILAPHSYPKVASSISPDILIYFLD